MATGIGPLAALYKSQVGVCLSVSGCLWSSVRDAGVLLVLIGLWVESLHRSVISPSRHSVAFSIDQTTNSTSQCHISLSAVSSQKGKAHNIRQ